MKTKNSTKGFIYIIDKESTWDDREIGHYEEIEILAKNDWQDTGIGRYPTYLIKRKNGEIEKIQQSEVMKKI